MSDLIDRQLVLDRINKQREHLRPYLYSHDEIVDSAYRLCAKFVEKLPSVELEIIRCKDCKYWNEGNCNCPDIRVDCPDYYVGDIVTEEDFYCGFAKRREE